MRLKGITTWMKRFDLIQNLAMIHLMLLVLGLDTSNFLNEIDRNQEKRRYYTGWEIITYLWWRMWEIFNGWMRRLEKTTNQSIWFVGWSFHEKFVKLGLEEKNNQGRRRRKKRKNKNERDLPWMIHHGRMQWRIREGYMVFVRWLEKEKGACRKWMGYLPFFLEKH